MDLGKYCSFGHAIQYAEMGLDENSRHLEQPLFLPTCLSGNCTVGEQKQCVPKTVHIIIRIGRSGLLRIDMIKPLFMSNHVDDLQIDMQMALFMSKTHRAP